MKICKERGKMKSLKHYKNKKEKSLVEKSSIGEFPWVLVLKWILDDVLVSGHDFDGMRVVVVVVIVVLTNPRLYPLLLPWRLSAK